MTYRRRDGSFVVALSGDPLSNNAVSRVSCKFFRAEDKKEAERRRRRPRWRFIFYFQRGDALLALLSIHFCTFGIGDSGSRNLTPGDHVEINARRRGRRVPSRCIAIALYTTRRIPRIAGGCTKVMDIYNDGRDNSRFNRVRDMDALLREICHDRTCVSRYRISDASCQKKN